MSEPLIHVAVIDPNDIYRWGCKALFETDARFDLVANVSCLAEMTAPELGPDTEVVLLDPVTRGNLDVETVRQTRWSFLSAALLLITDRLDGAAVGSLVSAGVRGFLLKPSVTGTQVLHTVLLVARSELSVVDDSILSGAVEQRGRGDPTPVSPFIPLSVREQEIMRLLSSGMTDSEIAHTLAIAKTTVYTHIGSISRKLPARNRVQLGIYAAQSGLLNHSRQTILLSQVS